MSSNQTTGSYVLFFQRPELKAPGPAAFRSKSWSEALRLTKVRVEPRPVTFQPVEPGWGT